MDTHVLPKMLPEHVNIFHRGDDRAKGIDTLVRGGGRMGGFSLEGKGDPLAGQQPLVEGPPCARVGDQDNIGPFKMAAFEQPVNDYG